MQFFAATITAQTIVLAERNDSGLVTWLIGEEARPASFADADTMLAAHGYGRTGAWELGTDGTVFALVQRIDNKFNGTVAARLDQAVGTTHDAFELVSARTIGNGDLITDADHSEVYVVAGSSIEGNTAKVHMVAEGKTWNDRYTSLFSGVAWVARRKR